LGQAEIDTTIGILKRASKRAEEEGRFPIIDPRDQGPGPAPFAGKKEELYTYSEDEEDSELENPSLRMDDDEKEAIKGLWTNLYRRLGRQPSLGQFREFLQGKGLDTSTFNDTDFSNILSTVFSPHGGSDNATNLRTPGQPPGKVSDYTKPETSGGPNYPPRKGSGKETYPSNYQSMREGGYINPSQLPSPTPTRSRGLTEDEARAQMYGRSADSVGDHKIFPRTQPGQAYSTHPKATSEGLRNIGNKSLFKHFYQNALEAVEGDLTERSHGDLILKRLGEETDTSRTEDEEARLQVQGLLEEADDEDFKRECEATHPGKSHRAYLQEEDESDEDESLKEAERRDDEARRLEMESKALRDIGKWEKADARLELAKESRLLAMGLRRKYLPKLGY
jgi:hypothetical protein